MRTVRDPIHGDIDIPPIPGAVVDSLAFQRLRYVRQNGLLHFVFPGAVHTRFAHSIGTMANARSAWPYLVSEARMETSEQSAAAEYVRLVFELAALLHDVGHCAFSHSAEEVTINGAPLFGTFSDLCTNWGEQEFLDTYEAVKKGVGKKRAMHEEIGLLLVRRIFAEDTGVGRACKRAGIQSADLGQDVLSILKEELSPTPRLQSCLTQLSACLGEQATGAGAEQALRRILNRLVSGTLDVDRMDYLLRDAFYCGVPYGVYERDLLLAGLRILPVSGELTLCVSSKVTLALDDLLWSRYQMFAQVYNHKTNVIMNRMLALALENAMRVGQADLTRPKTFEDYLAFTDDLVMGKVFGNCLRAPDALATVFGRTLTRRSVPRLLESRMLDPGDDDAATERYKQQVANRFSIPTEDVVAVRAKSEVLKADSELPTVFSRSKKDGDYLFESFVSRSALVEKLVPVYRRVHFYDVTLSSDAS